eukprot:scaffold14177_cov124-Isochrysis_galbana.AAC.6
MYTSRVWLHACGLGIPTDGWGALDTEALTDTLAVRGEDTHTQVTARGGRAAAGGGRQSDGRPEQEKRPTGRRARAAWRVARRGAIGGSPKEKGSLTRQR